MQADPHTLSWSAAADAAAEITTRWAAEEPGGAVLGFDAREIRFARCGGRESLSGTTPFSADSVVRYASITKHIFNTMLRRHAAEIGLDDPLARHLPFLSGALRDVTVGRALDMTGGLPDVRETMSLLGITTEMVSDGQPVLDFIGQLDRLNFAPGTEVSYSNTGYRLVEAALARKGHAFQDYLDAHVNRPLGIRLTAPDLWTDPVPGLCPGYWKGPQGWQLTFSGIQLSASGCVTGSGADLARWTQALMSERLGPGVLSWLCAPRHFADGTPSDYALGLAHTRIGTLELLGHGGSHLGYKSYVLFDPVRQVGVVVVSNREDTTSYPIALEVMAALFGLKLPPRSRALPDGLYLATQGPEWLEVKDGVAAFLGTGETLHEGPDGWAVSLSAHFPMRLRAAGSGIEGTIGHVPRRFARVEPGAASTPFEGTWVHPAFHAALEVAGGSLSVGPGPARQQLRLTALDANRALAEDRSGPWPRRACLLVEGNSMRAVLNRSRVLTFTRA